MAAAQEWNAQVSSGVFGEFSQDGITIGFTGLSVGAAGTPQQQQQQPSAAGGSGAGAGAAVQRPNEKRAWASLFSPEDNKTATALSAVEGRNLLAATPALAKAGTVIVDAHTDKKSRREDEDHRPSTQSPNYNAAANRVFEDAAQGQGPTGERAVAVVAPASAEVASQPSLTQQELGERLYPLITRELHAKGCEARAGKITGMLLDGVEHAELVAMLSAPLDLTLKVQEAMNVLNEATSQSASSAPESASPAIAAAPDSGAASVGSAESGPSTPQASVPFEPLNERRIKQRERQLELGKTTEGFKNFWKVVKASHAVRGDPLTPNAHKVCSKRCFDGICLKWRRDLHKFDDWSACEAMIAKRLNMPRSSRVAYDRNGVRQLGRHSARNTPKRSGRRGGPRSARAPALLRRSQSMRKSNGAGTPPGTPAPALQRSSSAPSTPATFVLEKDFPALSPRT